MKEVFIVNPSSGKGKIKHFIEGISSKENREIIVPSNAAETNYYAFLKSNNEESKVIYAVGGDGTLNSVLNGVVGSKAIMGVIPLGSGNDFARTLKEEKITAPTKIDIGQINYEYFLNIASLGFDARVCENALKNRHIVGHASYIIGLIQEILKKIEVDQVTNKEIFVTVEKSYKSKRKLNFKLYLAQSPLRSDAQSTVIEKATELGVDGVYPVYTDNCALSSSVIEKKIPKWQRIMQEAFKQCERAYIPTCFELTDLKNIIEFNNNGFKIIAFCERCANMSLHEYCECNHIEENDKLIVIIGPEGGFSEREFELFRKNNIPMLTLGELILKADTAVTVALGNIIYEFNNYRQN